MYYFSWSSILGNEDMDQLVTNSLIVGAWSVRLMDGRWFGCTQLHIFRFQFSAWFTGSPDDKQRGNEANTRTPTIVPRSKSSSHVVYVFPVLFLCSFLHCRSAHRQFSSVTTTHRLLFYSSLSGPGFICIYRIYRIYRPWWWWYKLIININIWLLICNTGQCSTHVIYIIRAYKSYKCISIRALIIINSIDSLRSWILLHVDPSIFFMIYYYELIL